MDTSRCFMGQARFEQLLALLPSTATVAGIDEHTARVMDLAKGICRVMGRGGVTLRHEGMESRFGSGQTFALDRLGPFHLPEPEEGISPRTWAAASAATQEPEAEAPHGPPPEVLALVQTREAARTGRDWPLADTLRVRIAEQGWRVQDTPDGPVMEPIGPP